MTQAPTSIATRTSTSPVANVTLFDHPLIQHKLGHLRERGTSHRPFRALMYQIAGLMVFEATRHLPVEPVQIETPLETMTATRLAAKITVIPILRAGLGLAEGILEMMPEARIGHLGLARDEATLQPRVYLRKLPRDIAAGPVFVVDPMLATGGSAIEAIRLIRDQGANDIRYICLVASPEGVEKLTSACPGVPIYAAAVDRCLSEHGFILPGLGDAGDRLYGTH
jgi:uracil phosphoribosyltransferase